MFDYKVWTVVVRKRKKFNTEKTYIKHERLCSDIHKGKHKQMANTQAYTLQAAHMNNTQAYTLQAGHMNNTQA